MVHTQEPTEQHAQHAHQVRGQPDLVPRRLQHDDGKREQNPHGRHRLPEALRVHAKDEPIVEVAGVRGADGNVHAQPPEVALVAVADAAAAERTVVVALQHAHAARGAVPGARRRQRLAHGAQVPALRGVPGDGSRRSGGRRRRRRRRGVQLEAANRGVEADEGPLVGDDVVQDEGGTAGVQVEGDRAAAADGRQHGGQFEVEDAGYGQRKEGGGADIGEGVRPAGATPRLLGLGGSGSRHCGVVTLPGADACTIDGGERCYRRLLAKSVVSRRRVVLCQ